MEGRGGGGRYEKEQPAGGRGVAWERKDEERRGERQQGVLLLSERGDLLVHGTVGGMKF